MNPVPEADNAYGELEGPITVVINKNMGSRAIYDQAAKIKERFEAQVKRKQIELQRKRETELMLVQTLQNSDVEKKLMQEKENAQRLLEDKLKRQLERSMARRELIDAHQPQVMLFEDETGWAVCTPLVVSTML